MLTIANVAYPFAPVGPDVVGGAEQVLSAIDRALVAAGHRSLVIACDGSSTAGTLLATPRPGGVLNQTAMELAWIATRAQINVALVRHKVDIVHLHGIDFPHYLPQAFPTLVTLHLPLAWYDAEHLLSPRLGLWLHGVSASQYETAATRANLLPPIPNGVDVARLRSRHAKRSFALTLGRICQEKGFHLAIEAARLARYPLLIGGEVFAYESHRRYFDEKVMPLLDETRRFIGPLGFQRKRRLMAAARCVLVPSLAPETSSLVAMEAMACGTPVIAFPNGALASLIEPGRTGFLVDTVEEMADAIAAAGEIDPDTCRQVAQDRFSLGAMTSSYLELYCRLTRQTA